jgi:hypothetical protein
MFKRSNNPKFMKTPPRLIASRVLLACCSTLVLTTHTALAQFTAGRVVVLKSVESSAGGAGFLVEYDRTGASSYQVTLPSDSTTNANTSIVFGNNSPLCHNTSLSADGAMVIIPGYANVVAGVDGAASAAASPRVVATVKYDGTYARPFSYSGNAITLQFRSATSDGFGNFWGNGSDSPKYLNTMSAISGGALRAIAVVGGNLTYSRAPAGNFGVYQVSGLPTTGAVEGRIIDSALMGAATSTPGGFALPSNAVPVVGSIAYVTDYNGSPNKGVGHYHWDGSTWVWDYNLILTGEKPQNIAVDYSGANPFVYVVNTPGSANHLYAFDDTNATAVKITIATAPTGSAFRGVVMAPHQPATPTFTVQPVNTTNNYGGTAVFGPVSADNANPNGYTWKKGATTLTDGTTASGSVISGSTTPTLTISGISGADAGTYFAVASNNGGSTSSSGAILALAGSSITTQLVSRTNVAGTTATFHVVSSGPPPLTYSWLQGTTPLSDGPSPSGSGATISGSATSTLTISGVQDGDAGSYTVTVTDNSSAQSVSSATLTVVHPPSIDTQPVDQNKTVGAAANFSVSASGGGLSYRWFKGASALNNGTTGSGSIIFGAQTASLTISNVQSGDVGSYSVTVTNLAGTVTSDPASLSVGVPPTANALANSTNILGSDAVFSAVVTSGTAPLTYTWKHNGVAMSDDGFHIFGSSTATLSITNIIVDDRRQYSVSISNGYGGITVSALLYVVIDTNKPNEVPNLIIYEPFNYPTGPTTAVGFYSWENVISIYNRITGSPAFWFNTGGGLNSGVLDNDLYRYDSVMRQPPGLYPWPGIDCSGTRAWNFASGGNNNHLKFGGVTNGAAYFSFIFHGDQGGVISSSSPFDVIAGFTSGDSTIAANANTWNLKLCTKPADAGDAYQLGIFKGNNEVISSSSVNGQFAPQLLLRGCDHLIVGCYKFNSGGTTTNDDIVSLWIDPPRSFFGHAENSLPTPDAGGVLTNWNNNAAVTEFAIRASGSAIPFSKRIADLRIGKTWASVTGPHYPALTMTRPSPDVILSWPAKDSFGFGPGFSSGHYGYQLTTASDVTGPYTYDANDNNSQSGTNMVVTETPSSTREFWQLFYPPRTGAYGQY